MSLSLKLSFLFSVFVIDIAITQSFQIPILDTLNSTVIYLRDVRNQTIELKGKSYSVGIYDDENEVFLPSKIENTGTGFIINNDSIAFIVTASHVAKRMSGESELILPDSLGYPIIHKMKDVMIGSNYWTNYWYINDERDIAIGVLNFNELMSNTKLRTFGTSSMPDTFFVPKRESQLLIIGFPQNSSNIDKKFSTVSKFVKASSDVIEIESEESHKISQYILLDDPSIKGFSGAPVFLTPHFIDTSFNINYDFSKLIGMVNGTYADNTGGKFATIVPSSLIVKTIQEYHDREYTHIVRHKNGKPWIERKYKGFWLPWEIMYNLDKNGKPQEKGTLKNGTGTEYLYDEDGNLESIREYKNGKLINETKIKTKSEKR